MTQIHLYLWQGIIDSLCLNKSMQRYLSPDQEVPFYVILFKVLIRQGFENEHTQIIATTTANIWRKAGKFMIIVFILEWLKTFLQAYMGYYITSFIYWVIVLFIYLENALQMWVWQQEIGQEVVNMELQHYSNHAFVEYQIDAQGEKYNQKFINIQSQSALKIIHRSFSRLLFNILFQMQTNCIGFIIFSIIKIPQPIDQLLRIPLFALFHSVLNTSTKIPFQEHLPYYFDRNIPYLVGLNLLQSSVLHFATYPIFTGMQWAMTPLFILNSISMEPPRLEFVNGETIIHRDTYKIHLKSFINSAEYQQKCAHHKGFMTLPAILTPPTQRLLDMVLKKIESLYGQEEEDQKKD